MIEEEDNMREQTFYADSAAPDFGDGSKSKPFNDLALVPWKSDRFNVLKIVAGSTFDVANSVNVPSFARIEKEGSGPDPILDGGDRALYGIIRIDDPTRVTVSGVKLQRARHAMLINGTARDCLVKGVTAEECYGLGGFAHEDTSLARGRVVFQDCHAVKCEGDGFSNRGGADDLFLNCTAVHCGPIWGVYELRERIPAETRRVNYLPVDSTKPTIIRNVYVDSVGGSNSNDGLSPDAAWQTLDKVETSSLAGDRIHFKRGSSYTGTDDAATLTVKSDQELTTYGTGKRPNFNTFNNECLVLNGVSRVWVEGLQFKACAPAIQAKGTVADIWAVDCLFYQSKTLGVEANDASGSGDINLFRCGFQFNELGAVHGVAGGYEINAWDCRGKVNGSDIDDATAAAWLVTDDCTFTLRGVEEVEARYRALALDNDTGTNLIFACWFGRPETNAGTTVAKAIEISGDGTHEIANTVATIINPSSGETSIGLHATAGTVKTYNCTFQDTRDSGGNGSSSVTVTSGVARYEQKNCVFDAENGNASTVYVTLDATLTGKYDFSHNFYHDWSGDLSLAGWYDTDAAATMAVAAWVAIDGNTEESNGGLPSDQLTKNLPASARGLDARMEDEPTAIHFAGLDLAAEGLVTWTTDAGHRERGRNPSGGWMPGAWINLTGSPDGFTTHADSAMRIEGGAAIWCQNGIDFTHDHAPTAEECGLHGVEFIECYDGGIEQAITRAFPIVDCRFIGGSSSAIDLNPPSGAAGDTWYLEGCEFVGVAADSMLKLRSNAAITVNVSSCVFHGPESNWWPLPAVTHGNLVSLGNGDITANFDNCAFWMPVPDSTLSLVYGIRIESAADGVTSCRNSSFYANDTAFMQYVRADDSARLGVWDNNYYHDQTSNVDNWRVSSSLDWSEWQALNKGTGGQATDDDGWNADDKIDARPGIGDERYFGSETYRALANTPQASGGVNRSAVSRHGFGGSVRPSTGAWGIGPFAAPASSDTVFRSGRALSFAGLVLGGRNYQNIRLGEGSAGSVELFGQIWNSAGSDLSAIIHVGPLSLGQVVWTGLLNSAKDAAIIEGIATPPGEELRISFGSSSGTIYGEIRWRESRELAATMPQREAR